MSLRPGRWTQDKVLEQNGHSQENPMKKYTAAAVSFSGRDRAAALEERV